MYHGRILVRRMGSRRMRILVRFPSQRQTSTQPKTPSSGKRIDQFHRVICFFQSFCFFHVSSSLCSLLLFDPSSSDPLPRFSNFLMTSTTLGNRSLANRLKFETKRMSSKALLRSVICCYDVLRFLSTNIDATAVFASHP